MAGWLQNSDVVVVTGGSQGLGAQIAKIFAEKGFKVAALDIALPTPENKHDGVLYLVCDITNFQQLNESRDKIEKSLGQVSVVVNNAGIRTKMVRFPEMDVDDISKTLDVNLGGSVKATKTFLPAMLEQKRGFVVNIASALSFISPVGLSAYGASKAGMLAFHESLHFELKGTKNMKLLLVCPGQLDTRMFSDLETPSRIFAPVVSQDKLAAKIVKRIMRGKAGTIYDPLYVQFMPMMRTLPNPMASLLRRISGVDTAWEDALATRETSSDPEGSTARS